jgi:hypothetical protein
MDAMTHRRMTVDSEVAAATRGHLHRAQASRSGGRRALAFALSVSLLVHALLLSLKFGDDEFGLPGLAFPWRDRRIEVPDLRIVLVPAHVAPAEPAATAAAEPSQRVPIETSRDQAPARTLAWAAPDRQAIPATNAPAAEPPVQADAMPSPAAAAPATDASLRAQGPGRLVTVETPEPAAITVKPSDEPGSVAGPDRSSSVSAISEAPSASSADGVDALEAERQENARQAAVRLELQRAEDARKEAARVELARLEAERQEDARQVAVRLELQRQEAARQEAARVEVARLEAERQERAQLAAVRLEAQRQEAARQEAARVEVARLENERRENERREIERREIERRENERQAAVRLEAQRQQTARQEAARVQPVPPEAPVLAAAPPVPRVEVGQDEARREAVLRAIGRQLDEEADRRQAASAAHAPSPLPHSLSTGRRVRLWGRTDPNVELVQYAEAWARKIQFNTVVEAIRDVVKRPHTPSMVTVAVRSDGSVEAVTFVVSSGVAEIDETIRRIVESQRPYPAFPRALARDFDVIEIRRTWFFDSGVRLQ